jgi:hypothetical protein
VMEVYEEMAEWYWANLPDGEVRPSDTNS